VHRARNIRVVLAIKAVDRLDDLPRLLRGVGAVEIHQRFAVHLALEDREVPANPGPIDLARGRLRGLRRRVHADTSGNCSASNASQYSRNGMGPMSSSTIEQNARTRMRRAVSSGMPRERR